jgi:nucleoside diphosphate kinase
VLDLDRDVDWDRTAFGLICPDAIVRHLGVPIVRRLEEHGFAPVAWKCFWHRPENLDAYFEPNITQVWHGYLYRLADRVFSFGPTLALLVRDLAPDPELGSHRRLRAVKGSSEPAKASPGTIRGDFGSINVSLGLVHSADSAAESRREAEVFVGRDGFPAGQDPADLYGLLGVLESMRPAERREYDDVLAGVRARIVAVLWDELPAPARELAAKLQAGGVAALSAPGAGAQLADLLPAGHPLEPMLRCEFMAGEPGIEIDRAGALLRAYGTALDPWEDLVLATSMRFEPRRRPASQAHLSGSRTAMAHSSHSSTR